MDKWIPTEGELRARRVAELTRKLVREDIENGWNRNIAKLVLSITLGPHCPKLEARNEAIKRKKEKQMNSVL